MKTRSLSVFSLLVVPLFTTILAPGLSAHAQGTTNGLVPVVTIYATDPAATPPNDTGRFTVRRAGSTNYSLSVFYHIGGTASNGGDYATIPSGVQIPAGSLSADITIYPKATSSSAGDKTVVLQIIPSPLECPTPPCGYDIGYPSNATVTIHFPPNSTTNIPPSVQIVSPTNGAGYHSPTNIGLFARASDPDDTVTLVEFFANNMDLGRGVLVVLDPPGVNGVTGPVYYFNWTNVPPGNYSLTAVAADDRGASTRSGAVSITVLPGSTTNVPPTAQIVSPTNGATFFAYPNITICADARDADGYVNTVEFFANNQSLGIRTNCLPCASPQNPFCLNWGNVPPGNYTLTAKATDNAGAMTVSAPVNITVTTNPPPNQPPFVRLNSPQNGAVFQAPATISLNAYAQDQEDGYNLTVEFFEGTNSLGFGTFVPTLCPSPYCPFFALTWSNVPPGNYVLTARATDKQGATTVSAPVNISVVTNLPPPTPVVSIFTLDAIASEGTNFCHWVGSTTGGVTNNPGTNGPCTNTATFVVRRSGSTNAGLTVNYSIGGTATNGVDYETLSGAVTIPAGHRSARITVVPIDDTIPEPIETVILKLLQPTNSPPAYVVGYASRAAAMIVDIDQPRPTLLSLFDHCFHVTVPGTNGAGYRLEISSDLLHWTPVCTNAVTDGAIHYVDPDAPDVSTRFYRALPEPYVPLDD